MKTRCFPPLSQERVGFVRKLLPVLFILTLQEHLSTDSNCLLQAGIFYLDGVRSPSGNYLSYLSFRIVLRV